MKNMRIFFINDVISTLYKAGRTAANTVKTVTFADVLARAEGGPYKVEDFAKDQSFVIVGSDVTLTIDLATDEVCQQGVA